MKTPGQLIFRRDGIGRKIPVAVRFIFPPDDDESASVLSDKSKVVPVPELGGIAINLHMDDVIESFKLKHPIKIGGLTARHRADVKDDAGRLMERWFAATVPDGVESFAHFVDKFRQTEAQHRAVQHRSVLVEKSPHEKPSDIRATTRQACEQLLREEYPRMSRAIDNKLTADEIRKAFVADLWALVGKQPEIQEVERFTKDRAFNRWLSTALAKPGERNDADWILALGWLSKGFYRMKEPELGETLNKLCGLNLKPCSWTQKARRLGLVNAAKKGRPTAPFAD